MLSVGEKGCLCVRALFEEFWLLVISPGVVELAADCRNIIGALLEILVDIVHKYCRLCVIMAISPEVVELAADCRL